MFSFATDIYLTYSLIRKLAKEFSDWDAFKTGVIDKDGNILISKDKRTDTQKDSFRMFDVAVLNMKKLLAKIPGGSTKFATYAAALFLLKEPKKLNEDVDMISIEEEMINFIEEEFENIMQYMNENQLNEEIVNTVGSGSIAGTNSNDAFGHRVFDVDSSAVWNSRNGKHPKHKYKKYVGEDDTGEEIRQYGRKNPKKGIILRNKNSGEMVFLRRNKLNEAASANNTNGLDTGPGEDFSRLTAVLSAKSILKDLESSEVFDNRLSKRLKAHFARHTKETRLNNAKNPIRMRVDEDITVSEFEKLKTYVHNLFAQFKIDTFFTAHFLERVNDARNKPDIKLDDLKIGRAHV